MRNGSTPGLLRIPCVPPCHVLDSRSPPRPFMIEVTILNAQELARQQMGARAAQAARGGADIESAVRNQMADRLEKGFRDRGIKAHVDTKGARKLEITIEDATEAAWQQGYLAWLVAKFIPSTVEQNLAPEVRDRLKEQGIEAEVDVK